MSFSNRARLVDVIRIEAAVAGSAAKRMTQSNIKIDRACLISGFAWRFSLNVSKNYAHFGVDHGAYCASPQKFS